MFSQDDYLHLREGEYLPASMLKSLLFGFSTVSGVQVTDSSRSESFTLQHYTRTRSRDTECQSLSIAEQADYNVDTSMLKAGNAILVDVQTYETVLRRRCLVF